MMKQNYNKKSESIYTGEDSYVAMNEIEPVYRDFEEINNRLQESVEQYHILFSMLREKINILKPIPEVKKSSKDNENLANGLLNKLKMDIRMIEEKNREFEELLDHLNTIL